jgi:UDP-GlcNAc:undecaprenyl-phosphate/decaprenyl-phosphate GlcNAc-1-phosphate transferase
MPSILVYNIIFTGALALAFIFGKIVLRLAEKFNIMDNPGPDRKLHEEAVPLLGGVAIFLSFFIFAWLFRYYLLTGNLEPHHWLGVFAGALIIIIGGMLDDKFSLPPKLQFIFPLLAALAVAAGGVGIEKMSGFSGGLVYLNNIKFPILEWGGKMHFFVLIADSFTILWLLGMMYTTKLLDGLDGLVSGMAAIGAFIIFLFTMTTKYYQPDIGLAALMLAGAALGFLILNWHPAKIFLGEGGSLLLGFLLGVLAIISGGKIAIALLVMGIPILDTAWTIIRRIAAGKNPFKISDRLHLHHRLYDMGLGHKKTVLLYYAFASFFGLAGLFLQSRGKYLALIVLVVIMAGLVIWLSRKRE